MTSFTCYAVDGEPYLALDPLLITNIRSGRPGETTVYARTHPQAMTVVDYVTFESFEDAQQRWHDTLCARLAANRPQTITKQVGNVSVTRPADHPDWTGHGPLGPATTNEGRGSGFHTDNL